MPLVLALDQSTSATKALLFDETGRMLGRESREHRQHYPRPGWVEHDAGEIWSNTVAVVRALVDRLGDRVRELVCLSLTNQRETIVVFDRKTGAPLCPAIVWQDRRGDEICAAHTAAGHEALVRSRTGLRIDAYFSGSKLQWLMRERPDLRQRMIRGDAIIGTIDAYLVHRLTNGAVFATDPTNASRTLLYDITALGWDSGLCSMWEVPLAALPEVRPCAARFGVTTVEGTLPSALPICGVMGDSQASLFAQRCFRPGDAKVTFGTGSSLLLNMGPAPRFSDKGVVTALAWVHDGVPTYAFEGIIISSASTLTWLRDQLGLVATTAEIEALANSVPDTGGVHLVPAFSGLGLPHWRADARAAILGLSAHSDRRHVARAALESIGFRTRDALEAMRGEAGVDLAAIHADGGPTSNRLLMQFTADVTGANLRVAATPDCSPLGAAFAGLLGLAAIGSIEELSALPRHDTVYEPLMPPAQRQVVVDAWHRAIRQVLAVGG